MVVAFKVFKKSAPNGKLTVYLGKRDYVDNLSKIESIDGIVVADEEYLKGRKVYGQVVCSFRYGREEDEVMGLEFQKELLMASGEIIPGPEKVQNSKLQERLLKKLGSNAFPFTFQLPQSSPPSVTLRPQKETEGKPCGVEYSLRVFIGDNAEDKPHKRNSVSLGLRIVQFAPSKTGRQPCTVVRRDFVLSPGELEMELSLDKQVFHHGESIAVNLSIQNKSNKTVKKIRASIQQCIDVCLFDHGSYKTGVADLETTEGCPLPPGGSFTRTFTLCPRMESAQPDRRGIALDGRMKDEKCDLASTTLMANPDDRDSFGIVVTYAVKVRLFLGALAGELVGELPFIFMHPRQNPRKLEHNDSVAVEAFRQDTVDSLGGEEC